MKTYTREELQERFSSLLEQGAFEVDSSSGQLILYTGVFEWKDGTFRDCKEPKAPQNDVNESWGFVDADGLIEP